MMISAIGHPRNKALAVLWLYLPATLPSSLCQNIHFSVLTCTNASGCSYVKKKTVKKDKINSTRIKYRYFRGFDQNYKRCIESINIFDKHLIDRYIFASKIYINIEVSTSPANSSNVILLRLVGE